MSNVSVDMPSQIRPFLANILVFLLVSTSGAARLFAQDQPPAKLNIEIIEGEDAVNNIRLRTGREPIVEVTDENHKPIAGALVIFSTPAKGAGGRFATGGNSLSVTTDAQGRAVGRGFQANTTRGKYSINVSASYLGVKAVRNIRQTNRGGLSLTAQVLIAAAVVAGVAIGVAATRGGGGGGSKPSVLSPGPPTVGAPR